jgi:hypothetical protein
VEQVGQDGQAEKSGGQAGQDGQARKSEKAGNLIHLA